MSTVVTTKPATKRVAKRYYRRFFRRWKTSVYMYSHFKISVSGFIQYSVSPTVALPPQITFLPDTSQLTSSYNIVEILHYSPRFVSLCNIFENIRVRSAAIKVFKNVGLTGSTQYQPNALYFGFYYSDVNPTYEVMVGSENARLINYNGMTKFYCKFKSRLQSIKELLDNAGISLRLGAYSNMNATTQTQPTFNFNIDFYVTFNNCKV